MKSKLWVLLVLMMELALSLALKLYGTGLNETVYRVLTVVIAALAIGVMLRITGWRVPLGSRLKPIPSLLFLFGAFITIHVATNVWADLLRSSDPIYRAPGALGNVTPGTAGAAASIIFSIVIAPIKEEMIYRLGFLSALKTLMPPAFSLLISTVLFTISHIGGGPLWNLIPIAVAGLVLGTTYLTLGLPWTIALHALLNLMPLLSEKGFFRHTMESNFAFFMLLIFAVYALWVFLSRTIRLRKSIFGAS